LKDGSELEKRALRVNY